jgi:8-oxo-dGTP pyrophosphatase MutT (NUDIX family)
MNSLISRAWTEVVDPLLRRPKRVQVAALCYRSNEDGQKDVLLITSRDTGRWILPKGWPIDGMEAGQAAMQEAWEEAGVANGTVSSAPVGTFEYYKRFDSGADVPCVTDVFAVEVGELANDYPEQSERQRKWVSPGEAASLVDEPELRQLLNDF